jgi:histidinol dehydrogenase
MVERLTCSLDDAATAAGRVRALVPRPASVAEAVAGILRAVRDGGDAAVLEVERRFGGGEAPLRVTEAELDRAVAGLDGDVRAGLDVAIANVARVAVAWPADPERDVALPQGHRVRLREVPVRRAAVYAPGGRNPYPSTVVMGVVTARAAGVEEVVVAAPADPVVLAACALCGASEVFRMGGAQAIAALAYGTESVRAVDVIAGPGNLYVQEAKRQVSGRVGIDGFAGPSDLLVIAAAGADPAPLGLDLLAQGEHGPDSLVVAVSDDVALLDALAEALRDVPARAAAVHATDLDAALAFSEALAPEHLQLAGAAAEALAPRVGQAGCVFVGERSGTAFGDYVAGSNHTLPTEGAARFASGLNPAHFRRRVAEVHVGDAAATLARAALPIARAEGFPAHAASLAARASQ